MHKVLKYIAILLLILLLYIAFIFSPGIISNSGFPRKYPEKRPCLGFSSNFTDRNNAVWTSCYGYLDTGTMSTLYGEFGLPARNPVDAKCRGIKIVSKDGTNAGVSCYGFMYDPWLE